MSAISRGTIDILPRPEGDCFPGFFRVSAVSFRHMLPSLVSFAKLSTREASIVHTRIEKYAALDFLRVPAESSKMRVEMRTRGSIFKSFRTANVFPCAHMGYCISRKPHLL